MKTSFLALEIFTDKGNSLVSERRVNIGGRNFEKKIVETDVKPSLFDPSSIEVSTDEFEFEIYASEDDPLYSVGRGSRVKFYVVETDDVKSSGVGYIYVDENPQINVRKFEGKVSEVEQNFKEKIVNITCTYNFEGIFDKNKIKVYDKDTFAKYGVLNLTPIEKKYYTPVPNIISDSCIPIGTYRSYSLQKIRDFNFADLTIEDVAGDGDLYSGGSMYGDQVVNIVDEDLVYLEEDGELIPVFEYFRRYVISNLSGATRGLVILSFIMGYFPNALYPEIKEQVEEYVKRSLTYRYMPPMLGWENEDDETLSLSINERDLYLSKNLKRLVETNKEGQRYLLWVYLPSHFIDLYNGRFNFEGNTYYESSDQTIFGERIETKGREIMRCTNFGMALQKNGSGGYKVSSVDVPEILSLPEPIIDANNNVDDVSYFNDWRFLSNKSGHFPVDIIYPFEFVFDNKKPIEIPTINPNSDWSFKDEDVYEDLFATKTAFVASTKDGLSSDDVIPIRSSYPSSYYKLPDTIEPTNNENYNDAEAFSIVSLETYYKSDNFNFLNFYEGDYTEQVEDLQEFYDRLEPAESNDESASDREKEGYQVKERLFPYSLGTKITKRVKTTVKPGPRDDSLYELSGDELDIDGRLLWMADSVEDYEFMKRNIIAQLLNSYGRVDYFIEGLHESMFNYVDGIEQQLAKVDYEENRYVMNWPKVYRNLAISRFLPQPYEGSMEGLGLEELEGKYFLSRLRTCANFLFADPHIEEYLEDVVEPVDVSRNSVAALETLLSYFSEDLYSGDEQGDDASDIYHEDWGSPLFNYDSNLVTYFSWLNDYYKDFLSIWRQNYNGPLDAALPDFLDGVTIDEHVILDAGLNKFPFMHDKVDGHARYGYIFLYTELNKIARQIRKWDGVLFDLVEDGEVATLRFYEKNDYMSSMKRLVRSGVEKFGEGNQVGFKQDADIDEEEVDYSNYLGFLVETVNDLTSTDGFMVPYEKDNQGVSRQELAKRQEESLGSASEVDVNSRTYSNFISSFKTEETLKDRVDMFESSSLSKYLDDVSNPRYDIESPDSFVVNSGPVLKSGHWMVGFVPGVEVVKRAYLEGGDLKGFSLEDFKQARVDALVPPSDDVKQRVSFRSTDDEFNREVVKFTDIFTLADGRFAFISNIDRFNKEADSYSYLVEFFTERSFSNQFQKNNYPNYLVSAANFKSRDLSRTLTVSRGVPEGSDKEGEVIPIVYGVQKQAPLFHAISRKINHGESVSAGDDIYLLSAAPITQSKTEDILVYWSLDQIYQNQGVFETTAKTSEDYFSSIDLASDYVIPNPFPKYREVPIVISEDETGPRGELVLDREVERKEEEFVRSLVEDNITGKDYDPGEAPDIEQIIQDLVVQGKLVSSQIRLPPEMAYQLLVDNETDNIDYMTVKNPYHTLVTIQGNDGHHYPAIKLRGEEYDDRFGRLDPRHAIKDGLGSSMMFATYTGVCDDSFGRYTGVPFKPITHPAHVALHILDNYCSISGEDQIDYDSFQEVYKKTPRLRCSLRIEEEEPNVKEIFEIILNNTFIAIDYTEGKFRAVDASFENFERPVFNFRDHLIFGLETEIFDESVTRFDFLYNYSYPIEEYDSKVTIDQNSSSYCGQAFDRRGAKEEKEIELRLVQDAYTANRTISNYVDIFSRVRQIVTFKYHTNDVNKNIQRFDDILVSSSQVYNHVTDSVGINEEVFRVISVNRNGEEVEVEAISKEAR